MPRICAVKGCRSRFKALENLSLHRLPTRPSIRREWLKVLEIEDGRFNRLYVCSTHFRHEDYTVTAERKCLRYSAIPELNMPNSSPLIVKKNENVPTAVHNPALLHDHLYTVSPGTIKRKLEAALEKEKRKKRKAQMDNIKKSMKIKSLHDLMSSMKEHGIKEAEVDEALSCFKGDAYTILFNETKNSSKQSTRRYSKELLLVASTIHYLSPRCYKYLRTLFALPSEVTLRKLYSKVDGRPGFTLQAMESLKYVQENSTTKLHWTLMLDCMSIRSQVHYNKNEDCNLGYTDAGNSSVQDKEAREAATQALTFMVVGINKHIKLTVGYFLVKKLTATFQTSLIKECLQLLHQKGIIISAVVCDGAMINKSSMTMLGVNLDHKNLQGTFPHPSCDQRVVYIPDVAHNLKLLRNLLADKQVLLYNDTEQVAWKHIQKTHEIQQEEGMRSANRLTADHINFARNKMKVKYAAQVFSSSVAASINLCKQLNFPEFGDSNGSAHFIRQIDRLFDMLNGRNLNQKGYKAPLFKSSRHTWEAFFKKTRAMLLSLKLSDGTLVASSLRGTPIIGFCLAMDGFISLADQIFNDPQSEVTYFLPYRLSQDQLELHFSKVRGRGGWNNNPTASQFQAAYRALLINSNIPVSASGNATCFIEAMGSSIYEDDVLPSAVDFADEIVSDDVQVPSEPAQLSPFQDNVTAYIAGYAVRKIRSKEYYCDKCKEALIDTTMDNADDCLQLIRIKDNGGLSTPSRSVLQVAMASERIVREEGTKPSTGRNIRAHLCAKILHHLNHRLLFPNLQEHVYDCDFGRNHVLQLIKDIIHCYLIARLHYVADTYTRKMRGQSIRNHLTRITIFKNQ